MSFKSFFKNLFSPSEYNKQIEEEMEDEINPIVYKDNTLIRNSLTEAMIKDIEEGRNQDRVQEALNATGDTSDGCEEFVEQEIREHREQKAFDEILADKKKRKAYKTECINKHSSHHIFRLWAEHAGTLVIYNKEVYKFIGIGTDEHDFFYVLMMDAKNPVLGSPVLDLIPLYEISDEHYKSLDFKLTKKRLKELTKEIEEFNILLDNLYAD